MEPVERIGGRPRILVHSALAVGAPLAAVLAIGCVGASPPEVLGRVSEDVIYGASSSRDWRDRRADSPLFERTFALVPAALASEPLPVGAPLLGELLPELCSGELWSEQPTWSVCSGILVGGRWALTARHCVESPSSCEDYALVRNYRMGADGLEPIARADIFSCERLIIGPDDGTDFAIIELDRSAGEDVTPFLPASSWSLGAPVLLAHHPLGTPLKIDDEARLIALDSPRVWADAFAGSSGAPVSDADGRLLGLLSGGARDFERAPEGCLRARQLDHVDEAGGEHLVPALPPLCDACATDPDPLVCASLWAGACGAADNTPGERHESLACAVGRAPQPSNRCLGLVVFLCVLSFPRLRSRRPSCRSPSISLTRSPAHPVEADCCFDLDALAALLGREITVEHWNAASSSSRRSTSTPAATRATVGAGAAAREHQGLSRAWRPRRGHRAGHASTSSSGEFPATD